MTALEQSYDQDPESLDRAALVKLIKWLKEERDDAQTNFRVTNRAYVMQDKQISELRQFIREHMAALGSKEHALSTQPPGPEGIVQKGSQPQGGSLPQEAGQVRHAS